MANHKVGKLARYTDKIFIEHAMNLSNELLKINNTHSHNVENTYDNIKYK